MQGKEDATSTFVEAYSRACLFTERHVHSTKTYFLPDRISFGKATPDVTSCGALWGLEGYEYFKLGSTLKSSIIIE